MHVMRNLGKRKKPISRIFGVPDPSGSFLGLAQPFCAFCTFYHILLISLSHAYRLFLHYALLHRFICNSFYSSKHLCACFITFHVAVVHLFLCRHYVARFYGCSCMYGCWLLIMLNYKDPWQHPVESDHAMGLWTVLNVLSRFKYCLMNR